MSKFKLTQTATEVQNILNNSLQKPTGLSKTELVGVGVNGQENIEIGDNLTLANGKLSSATGSLPSTIQFDAEGNRTASKDVKVDGKLKLNSLVSESNPDGDITKELGGGGGSNLYLHCITLNEINPDATIAVNFYSKNNEEVNTIESLNKYLIGAYGVVCSGYKQVGDHYAIVNRIDTSPSGKSLMAYYIDLTNGATDTYYISNIDMVKDTTIPVK